MMYDGRSPAAPQAATDYSGYQNSIRPADRPQLDVLSDRLESLINAATTSFQRLKTLNARYQGSTPEAVEKGSGEAMPNSVGGRLENSTRALDTLLGKILQEIERLERF